MLEAEYGAILSARWGNDAQTAILVDTEKAGSVLAAPDIPEKWAWVRQWRDAGGVVQAQLPRSAPPPTEVQLLREELVAKGILTGVEVVR